MDERFRRRCVRDSPFARRIGGLDLGAQRRTQRSFLHGDADRIRAMGPAAIGRSLRCLVDLAGLRSDVETDAGHNTSCSFVARLLATGTNIEGQETYRRKDPALRPVYSGLLYDTLGAELCPWFDWAFATSVAH